MQRTSKRQSLKHRRAAAEIKLSQCRAQRLSARAARSSLGGRLRAELARPGTLVGAFALGSLVGGGDTAAHTSDSVDARQLDTRLNEIEAALRDQAGSAGSVDDSGGASADGQDGKSEGQDVVDMVATVVTSIATRFAATLLLEKVHAMQQGEEA